MPARYVLCTEFENETAVVYMHTYLVINTKIDHHNFEYWQLLFFFFENANASALKKIEASGNNSGNNLYLLCYGA